jgi:acetyl-CoA hydrolase
MLASDGGRLGFGAQIDYLADALPRARVVVAEINDQAPVTFGEADVSPADIDHVIRVSRPLPQMRTATPGPVEAAIGEHVARLVPDGATLQVGLGVLPDAVLMALRSKTDLGIHSGTIGDRVADLMDAGVVTNRRKSIDAGLTVTAGLLGTERIYRFAHKNRQLFLRSPRYTHDNLVHAQIDGLIGINTALEVDLTGQMNAEVAGGRHLGMVGGHADFMRGCLRAPGGKGIVAMESTARGGTISRIVPKLADGVVTTSRSDADIVVTEHGVAELRGRTVQERAKALIAIADSRFRAELEAAAERLM